MTILCEKCSGSGVVAISSKNCRYVAPGPVPEGAKGVTESTCFECCGKGTIARDHTNPMLAGEIEVMGDGHSLEMLLNWYDESRKALGGDA